MSQYIAGKFLAVAACLQSILIFVLNPCVIYGATVTSGVEKVLNIAIIGAGPAGLFSAKHSLAYRHRVTVYEQNDQLGGIWVLYTNKTGTNQFGLDVHTAMYKDLRTNSPAPSMQVPDFHLPSDVAAFPSQADMLKYLHSYADHFNLNQHIKFNHLVVRVHPIKSDQWEVIVRNLLKDTFVTMIYDAIFVCNGRYFEPFIPNIVGANEFKGELFHSRNFQSAEKFQGIGDVLVIGAGPSGIDLAMRLTKVAKTVSISRNKPSNGTFDGVENQNNAIPPNVTLKDRVKRLTADGVEFTDRTQQNFSTIIYATGYKYSYPFLSVDSGIHVTDNFVQPIYKYIINIEHTTMAFIGLLTSLISFPVMDLQAHAAVKWLSGEIKLPSKQEMMHDLYVNTQAHLTKGYTKQRSFVLRNIEREYLDPLAEVCHIESLPDVLYNIAHDSFEMFKNQPSEMRKYKYITIDSSNFTRIKVE